MTNMSPIDSQTVRYIRVVAAALAGAVLALLLSQSIQPGTTSDDVLRPKTAISADFWYDTSDASMIAGDSSFTIVGRVSQSVRTDNGRTVFEVDVLKEIQGETPDSLLVSQMGYTNGENTWELEGFPLMQPGTSYVMSLAAPSAYEPQDALILLSGSGRGNKVEVSGVDDPLVAWYEGQVGRETSPYSRGASSFAHRIRDAHRWQDNHPGFRGTDPPSPK